jgi:glutathione S-transferase
MKTLFHYPLCPFSRKVRLVLAEKKIDFVLQQESVWKRREEFLDLNPFGQVPVYSEENGVFTESQAIVEYLDETVTVPQLMPTEPKERFEVRRLCHLIDCNFYARVTAKTVVEKSLKRLLGQGGPDSKVLREGNQNLSEFLDYFSWILEKRDWLAGPHLSLADFTLAAHLSCLDYIGHIAWEDCPEIKAWYSRLKSRPSFQPLLADSVAGVVIATWYRNLDF